MVYLCVFLLWQYIVYTCEGAESNLTVDPWLQRRPIQYLRPNTSLHPTTDPMVLHNGANAVVLLSKQLAMNEEQEDQ